MQNDDLGQFPSPNSATTPVFEPTPDNLDNERRFEEVSPLVEKPTPDEIQTTTSDTVTPSSLPKEEPVFPTSTPKNEPIPATLPTNSISTSASPLLTTGLIIVAGLGISGTVFMYSQSSALKRQLTDITQTLERQKTVITPTATPSVVEIPTSTPTLEATPSTIVLTPILTPTATPTATLSNQTVMPLALAPQALKVGIKHEPNAQLILIKTENAHDPQSVLTKYYFRKDLTTKKYFYVSVNSKNESEVVDKSIYVNPDNNIPTLNDLVLGNKLGIDFEEAIGIATKICPTELCKNASVKAQFIKSGTKTIWQISITPTDTTKSTLVIQIDSQNKEVLFKSPDFN